MKKLLKYCLLGLLLVIIVIAVAGFYFLNTTSGLQSAIDLADRYSGYRVSAKKVTGRLLGKTVLTDFRVTGKGMQLSSAAVVLDWQSMQLFNRSLNISDIHIKDTTLTVAAATEPPPQRADKPFELNDIDLPIGFKLSNLLVENLTIKNPLTAASEKDGEGDMVIDKIHLKIDYIGQVGKIHHLSFKGQDIDLQLQGQIKTQGDFPLSLNNTTHYSSTVYGNQVVDATVSGALKSALDFHLSGSGLSLFSLNGHITSPLKSPEFDAKLLLKQVDTDKLGLLDSSVKAEVSIRGNMADTLKVSADSEIFYQSPQTDKVKLNMTADFDGKLLTLSAMQVDLLTAQQQITGKGSYRLDDKAIAVKLNSKRFSWPQTAVNPALAAADLTAEISGYLDDYQLSINSKADTAIAGRVPVAVSANGSLQAVKDFKATLHINERPVDIQGNAAWQPSLQYHAAVKAPEIAPFKQFPGIKQLDIKVNGYAQAYAVNGDISVYADTIPPTKAVVNISGTPTDLQTAKVDVATLGGTITMTAKGALSPLDLSAQLTSKHIQPQTFYPDIEGNINSELHFTVKQTHDNQTHDNQTEDNQTDNNLIVTTLIKTLNGSFRKKPLSGKGKIVFAGNNQQINISGLNINIADNQVSADGVLALADQAGQSDLTAKINAKALNRLLPSLSGELRGKITAKGSIKQPDISADLLANKIAYQDNRLQQLKATAAVNLLSDKLQLDVQAQGIDSGGQRIDKAVVKSQGKLSAHTLTALISPPPKSTLPAVKLAAQGGLKQNSWQGKLSTLKLDSAMAGVWTMTKPSALLLSAENLSISPLCLQQQGAQLCTEGNLKNGQGTFAVDIKALKTTAFAKMMPPSVALDTTVAGQATVQLANGAPTVKAKLNAQGGQIKVAAGNGNFITKIQQFESVLSLKNNRLESVLRTQFSKLGKIHIDTVIPQINQANLQAHIKIDNDSLAFLQELLPQLSDVKGRLSGDMTVAGNPAKQLKTAGKITLHKTDFNVPQFGTQIREMTLDIFAQDGNQIGFKGGAKAGSGDFTVDGNINPGTRQGKIAIKGKNFQAADAKKIQVTINPDIHIVFAEDIQVRGVVEVPKALIVPESSGSKVTSSEDVILPQGKTKKPAKSSPVDAEIQVKLGDDVRVASSDIETRLSGAIKIIAKPGKAPTAAGTISVQTGALRIYGQQLTIERGRVIFSHGPIANPALDIRASRTIEDDDVKVGANVLGTVSKPKLSLFSTPSMSDSSILSYLLFGKPPNSNSFSSTALLQTGGVVGANTLARDLRASTGLDVLDFGITSMEAGKNLTKKIYVGMRSDFFEAINLFIVKYKISGRTHIDGSVGTDGISTDLVKEIETD